MIDQYTVDNYRIDLYFPKHKLAIECDEFDHSDRDIEYEVKRQNNIEEKLGCTFNLFVTIQTQKYLICLKSSTG